MTKPTYKTAQIIILAILLAFGTHIVVAEWSSSPDNPPSNGVWAPLNATTKSNKTLGALWVNTNGPTTATGLTVGQALKLSTAVPNLARIYITESGDAAGDWSGVELRKNGVMQGGLFKKGDTDEANNDITIWNKTKPVLSVKQNDVTEFAGTIKINGGSPAAGKVLMSGDTSGSATWQNISAGANGSYTLGATATEYPNKELIKGYEYALYDDPHFTTPYGKSCNYWDSRGWYMVQYSSYSFGSGTKIYCSWDYKQGYWDYTQQQMQDASCPAGTVLTGYLLYNLGASWTRNGSLFCTPFVGN